MYNIIKVNESTNTREVMEKGLTLMEGTRRIRENLDYVETTNIYYMLESE